MFVPVLLVRLVPPELVALTYSPTLPAFTLSFVVVPTIPFVLDGVIVLVAVIVVKAPVLGVVLPIGPGVEKRAVIPAPLTVPVAESVLNEPAFGVVPPIAGGAAR